MYSYFSPTAPSEQHSSVAQIVPGTIVGSPDQVHVTEALDSQSTDVDRNQDSESRRSRPSYGRSISSVVPLSSHQSEATGSPHTTASDFHVISRERLQPEREWSVFSQLMDRDDQYGLSRRSTSSTVRPRRALPPNIADVFESRSTRTHSTNTSAMTSVVQTPVATDPPPAPIATTTTEPDDFSEHDEYSDNSYDSPQENGSETPPATVHQSLWTRLSSYNLPPLYRNILKCSLAYFLGSLFTFSPYLSGFIADLTNYGSGERTPSPSGHMVATM